MAGQTETNVKQKKSEPEKDGSNLFDNNANSFIQM
jgi:hypothetical protein